MDRRRDVWVVVLAAGEGTRVRHLTRDRGGEIAPKQYSSIDGVRTMLESTLQRSMRITPRERIVVVVAAHHRRWWQAELGEIPPENIVVQPRNRGTATGILMPLLAIDQRDPEAVVAVLPSDHFVGAETTLEASLVGAVSAACGPDAPLVLLGIEPESVEEGLGWIVPCSRCGARPYRVCGFCEKPDLPTAASLVGRGALLNSFIMVACSRTWKALYRETLPRLWRAFEQDDRRSVPGRLGVEELARVYETIPAFDFSRDVLERAVGSLSVCPVPPCGWTDLGTPNRLERHLCGLGRPQLDDEVDLSHRPAGMAPEA